MARSRLAWFRDWGIALLLAIAAASCAATPAPSFELEAEWSPFASSTYGIPREPAFARILDPGPTLPRASYTWHDILPLLPPEGTLPGDVWRVEIEPLLVFLLQLHPSATGKLHHYCFEITLADLPAEVTHLQLPQGPVDVAELRASGVQSVENVTPHAPMGCVATLLDSGATVDVLLRVHAEFELVPEQVFFTPAQFEARLVVDPEAARVVAFSLAVPDRDSNVDINVQEQRNSGRADIGHVPRLALTTQGVPPSIPEGELAAARARLAREFYPFARIEWKPLAEAWASARATGRPLHVVQLFGTLDDESC